MKKIILSLSALLLSGMLYAQEEKQNAVVNVENDYNPVVVPVKKKSFTPKEESNETTAPLELKFSEKASPFDGFTSERSVREFMPKQDGAYNGYVRLGAGTGNGIDAKAAYNFRINESSDLKAFASFDGFKTDLNSIVDGHDWESRMYSTVLSADYTCRFEKHILNLTGSFNKRLFNYQNLDGKFIFPDIAVTDKQNCTDFNIYGNITSQSAGSFSYKIHGGVAFSHRAYTAAAAKGINETNVMYGGSLAHELPGTTFQSIGADIDANLFLYNSRMRNAASNYYNILSADISPYTRLMISDWKITAGIKMNVRSKGGPAVAVAPNITIDGLITDGIGLYAELKGGRVHNGFAVMDNITPYWNYNSAYSQQLKPTYKPIDLLLAARISRFEPVSLEAYMGYTYTKDDLLQVPGSMYNDIVYVELAQQDTRNFFFGVKAGYDAKGWINLSGDLRFSSWDAKHDYLLMMKPKVILDLNAEIRPIKDLSMRVGYNFTQFDSGKDTERIDNKNELYARISYQIGKRFGIYLQGNNLLDREYYDYAGYETRGIRCMAGATMNF